MSDRVLYTTIDAAAQLSVSPRTVERLIRDGELTSVKLGRRRLVPHTALTDYVQRLERA